MALGWLRTIGLDSPPKCGCLSTTTSNLTASTVCVITPPPLVRNIGEGRSGPQTVSAKTCIFESDTSTYSVSPILYIYTSCSAVAVIVVELRPGRHYCHAHMHLYIGLLLLTCCISFIISKYNLRGHLCNQRKHFHLFNTYRVCSASAIKLFFDIRFK